MSMKIAIWDAINSHILAVQADEASFTAEGKPISESTAEKTEAVETEAFRTFVDAPCKSSGEVQAKIAYVLNGTIGDRDTLLTTLLCYAGDNAVEKFLRSLLIEAA